MDFPKKKLIFALLLLSIIVLPRMGGWLQTDFGKASLFETYLHYQSAKIGMMPVIEPKQIKQKVRRALTPKEQTENVALFTENSLGEKPVSFSGIVSEETLESMKASTLSMHFTHDPLCQYEMPADPVLTADFKGVKLPSNIKTGEKFRVQLNLENTGNVRWYGDNSSCQNQRLVRLGTDRERDRASVFFLEGSDSGWLSNNRIKMKEKVVEPGEIATFEFSTKAPAQKDFYREYFAPLVETYAWFKDTGYYVDIPVGGVVATETHERMSLMDRTVKGSELTGDKNILVDLSDQRMHLRFGETILREFTVSTGKRATPTPKGEFKILNKMEVRVGAAWPHYVMPKWMGFTQWGHGIHALPSLGNDGGIFWTEARNHIGIPVSHGCIRLLPEDAEFAHDKFGEVGTVMKVVQ